MITRRTFFTMTGAGALALVAVDATGQRRVLAEALPGGTLAAGDIPRFVTALVIPGVMPRTSRLTRKGGKSLDTYEVAVRQFTQPILPAGLPATTVWGFGPAADRDTARFHAPSLTIEVDHTRPVRIRWSNELVDDTGAALAHLFAVDPTLHWANPERRPDEHGVAATDNRPSFEGLTYVPPESFRDPKTEYTAYRGPVPFVTHVHGAMHVGDESDGYTEAWFLPDATDLPDELARHGRWYPFFADKSEQMHGTPWGPGYSVSHYPNHNRASTMWYHDHTLGMTRLNVYAGPAGFFLVRGGPDGDSAVLDSRTGAPAVLPGPAPRERDRRPKAYGEIPLAIQDRSFNADGSLFYPDTRTFFDGFEGPFVPESGVAPVWNPEFFGNTLMVNGRVWPFHPVDQRRYRLRLLNGCNSRFLILDFSSIPGVLVHQIGNDGGLLATVHDVMAADAGRLLLAPAERADVIVDFAHVPPGNHVLRNLGPDEPYGGGEPDVDFPLPDPDTTGQVMQFRVSASTAPDPSTPAEFLALPAIAPLPPETRVRRLALLEHMHSLGEGGPTAALLGSVDADPADGPAGTTQLMWMDPVTENPSLGDTEVWEVYNLTADAHPVHIHEVAFEVVDRQPITVVDGFVDLDPDSPRTPPLPGETGRKDTVIAYPEEVTRVRATFGMAGQYVWHCHIVEHEDNEMMRPFRVGPLQPGQPE